MLTFFSCPKVFKNQFNIIQRNAVKSWTRLEPKPEIILLGKDEGVKEICRELGLRHIPDIKCNEYGTPLVNDIFKKAEKTAGYNVLCYINADIILFDDFMSALKRVIKWRRKFLMIGERWDLDFEELVNYDDPDWQDKFKSYVYNNGVAHGYKGVEYIVFTNGLFKKIPPFGIGRPSYDNWLIWKARSEGVPIIDVTKVVTCVHQNHKRTYTSLDKKPLDGVDNLRGSKEAEKNLELAGGDYVRAFSLLDSTHMMTPRLILPSLGEKYLDRKIGRIGESLKTKSPLLYRALRSIIK